jgi:hypothetical protein
VDVVDVLHGIPVIPEDRELISRLRTDLGSDTLWNDDTGLELYPRCPPAPPPPHLARRAPVHALARAAPRAR